MGRLSPVTTGPNQGTKDVVGGVGGRFQSFSERPAVLLEAAIANSSLSNSRRALARPSAVSTRNLPDDVTYVDSDPPWG
jgi:hypothetical protein